MTDVTLSIEEELSDKRSNEFAYKVVLTNSSARTIEIRSIVPRAPQGVELKEIKDIAREAEKDKYKRLCGELTELLRLHLIIENEEYKRKAIQMDMAIFREATKFSHLLRAYGAIFSREIKKSLENVLEKKKSIEFSIDSVNDAEIASARWFAGPDDETGKVLFQAKLEQLARIEESVGHDISLSALAHIEKDSDYTRNYVLKFKRGLLNQKRFNMSVDVCYVATGESEERGISASRTVTVSPKPIILSIVAILSALMGTVLKHSLFEESTSAGVYEYFVSMGRHLITNHGVSAVIMALVFFNLYEFTKVGENLKMPLGWRSALFIGFISGIGGERILNSLKALVGV